MSPIVLFFVTHSFSLIVIRCHSLYHLFAIRCTTCCHTLYHSSLSLVVTPYTTHLSFCKRLNCSGMLQKIHIRQAQSSYFRARYLLFWHVPKNIQMTSGIIYMLLCTLFQKQSREVL